MSFCLGLTGSIGMGKSTTAQMFVDEGCAIWDADAAVHRLYDVGGAAVEPLQALFPRAVLQGAVDRGVLKDILSADPAALIRIESVVHPLVARDRAEFRKEARSDVLVFDIPLLFETGGASAMDAVACVTAPPEVQEQRVLDRGTMGLMQFEQIRAKQMPDEQKQALSDYVIVTDTLEHARAQVHDIVKSIRRRMSDA